MAAIFHTTFQVHLSLSGPIMASFIAAYICHLTNQQHSVQKIPKTDNFISIHFISFHVIPSLQTCAWLAGVCGMWCVACRTMVKDVAVRKRLGDCTSCRDSLIMQYYIVLLNYVISTTLVPEIWYPHYIGPRDILSSLHWSQRYAFSTTLVPKMWYLHNIGTRDIISPLHCYHRYTASTTLVPDIPKLNMQP